MDLVGESDPKDESVTLVKWRDFEVETLIAIREEMDGEFSRQAKNSRFLFLSNQI